MYTGGEGVRRTHVRQPPLTSTYTLSLLIFSGRPSINGRYCLPESVHSGRTGGRTDDRDRAHDMARIRTLSARQIDTLPTGWHSDGGNLYLRVRDSGSRSWVFRYKVAGKVVEIGLGSPNDRELKQTRDLAGKMRTALADGENPANILKAKRDPAAMTFKAYAEELIAAKKLGFKNAKHIQQWGNTLASYAYPTIGDKLPNAVSLADVKAILDPLWAIKTETATRLRQRIEAVLDYAAVLDGEDRRNPARWRGNLDKVFQAPRKVTKPQHHAAAQYGDVPRIMAKLRERDSASALCLRFSILTAARSGEARGARWSEIDDEGKAWILPASRMKAGREHKVPLCDEVAEILDAMKLRKLRDNDQVFPGALGGLLSDVAINKTLHAIAPGVTAHGFRSSFRQWGAETTGFPSAVLELALAHTNPNKVEAAYQRSDLMERRKELMLAWGKFCQSQNNVVQLVQSNVI